MLRKGFCLISNHFNRLNFGKEMVIFVGDKDYSSRRLTEISEEERVISVYDVSRDWSEGRAVKLLQIRGTASDADGLLHIS